MLGSIPPSLCKARSRSRSGGYPAMSRKYRSTRSRGSDRERIQVSLLARRSTSDLTTTPSSGGGGGSMSATGSCTTSRSIVRRRAPRPRKRRRPEGGPSSACLRHQARRGRRRRSCDGRGRPRQAPRLQPDGKRRGPGRLGRNRELSARPLADRRYYARPDSISTAPGGGHCGLGRRRSQAHISRERPR